MHRKRFLTLITYHMPSIHWIVVNGRGVLLRHRVCVVYCSCKWRSSIPRSWLSCLGVFRRVQRRANFEIVGP